MLKISSAKEESQFRINLLVGKCAMMVFFVWNLLATVMFCVITWLN